MSFYSFYANLVILYKYIDKKFMSIEYVLDDMNKDIVVHFKNSC